MITILLFAIALVPVGTEIQHECSSDVEVVAITVTAPSDLVGAWSATRCPAGICSHSITITLDEPGEWVFMCEYILPDGSTSRSWTRYQVALFGDGFESGGLGVWTAVSR